MNRQLTHKKWIGLSIDLNQGRKGQFKIFISQVAFIVHVYMSKNENVSGISKCMDCILRFRLLTKPLKCRGFLRKRNKYFTVLGREIKIIWPNYVSIALTEEV